MVACRVLLVFRVTLVFVDMVNISGVGRYGPDFPCQEGWRILLFLSC